MTFSHHRIGFFLAVASTSFTLISERNEGLLDRSWVAGVRTHQLLLSHVITQFTVVCLQTALVLVFTLGVFDTTNKGHFILITTLTILQGLCGMSFGFLISAVSKTERDAIQLALGSFYPFLMLSGVIWPIEGMPFVLRFVLNRTACVTDD